MTATEWVTIASVATVVISALAIGAGLMTVRDQLRVTVFVTYTERYAKIMKGIPFEARQPGGEYRLASRPEDERIDVLSAFRDYFNLCSEELWLYEHRKIDRATWRIWTQGMQVVAQFPSFIEAWQALGFEYEYYADFHRFVNDILMPKPASPGSPVRPVPPPQGRGAKAARRLSPLLHRVSLGTRSPEAPVQPLSPDESFSPGSGPG